VKGEERKGKPIIHHKDEIFLFFKAVLEE
jgi:hypothetical protein